MITFKNLAPRLRAWDAHNKEMHYNFQYISSGNDWFIFTSDKRSVIDKIHSFDNSYFYEQFHIMPEIMPDVYVGDIIVAYDTESHQKIKGVIRERNDEYFYGVGNILFDELDLKTIKVVGNIFTA